MRILLVIPVFLFAISFTAADDPPEKELAPSPESKALSKLWNAIHAGDAKATQQVYEQLAKDFAGKEVADEVAWHYSRFLIHLGKLDQAQDLLLSMKRSGRKNGWVSQAVLGLAEVARKRGDFKKNLDYLTRWEPKSWCANCQASMQEEREREIALCQLRVLAPLRLGDHAAVLRDWFRQLQKDDWLGDYDAWVIWRLYGDADQLDDLRGMLDDYEKARKKRLREEQRDPSPTHTLRELLRVQSLAEKKDVAALVALCQEEIQYGKLYASKDGMRDLIHSAAAEALARVGGAEVEAIKSALGKGPKVTGWLIYALGRSNTPSALEVLKHAAERERYDDYEFPENLTYALALKGEPGKNVLKRLAEQESKKGGYMGYSARWWLERKAEPTWPASTWPRPKAGSLPKTMTDSR